MTKRQKTNLIRIAISAVLFFTGMYTNSKEVLTGTQLLFLYIPAYIIIGHDILWSAVRGIRYGQVFDENFLMSIATLGAFIIGEYPEAVAVMLFYQVGEFFQSYAVGKSRESISDLMDIRPDYANIEKNGKLVQVPPESILVGEHIVVVAGEKIPLDGVVIDGVSSVDTSALSGESVPRTLRQGDDAISGSINLNGVLTIEVTKLYSEGTVAQILDLVENASSKKANVENFITRFARYYTPAVVIAALLLAIVPPLVTGSLFRPWIYRALSFLVVSCPCALVISVPLSFFGGIGGASRQGILVKGSNYLEMLSQANVIVFDKTGTLTRGVFEVVESAPYGEITTKELLKVTALAESFSNHPISLSLKEEYGKDIDNGRISEFEDIPGHGIKALVDGKEVYAGNLRLMNKIGVEHTEQKTVGTVVHVAREGMYLGHFVIADRIKDDAVETISALNARGIETVMLTGDSRLVGESVAKELGIQTVYAELLPANKVEKLEEMLAERQGKKNARVAFVGDGINDAPVLTRADVGISMGALGSDAAIEASDIVLMDDKLSKIAISMEIAKKTIRIVKQNILFALGVKAIVLALSAFGLANMWQAVFADVGVSVIAIINAMRALNIRKDPTLSNKTLVKST